VAWASKSGTSDVARVRFIVVDPTCSELGLPGSERGSNVLPRVRCFIGGPAQDVKGGGLTMVTASVVHQAGATAAATRRKFAMPTYRNCAALRPAPQKERVSVRGKQKAEQRLEDSGCDFN